MAVESILAVTIVILIALGFFAVTISVTKWMHRIINS
jgi:hypothetical protein